MTRRWSPRSQEVYDTLDPFLQDTMDYVLRNVADVSLIKGHRPEEEQNEAFRTGHSKLKWPDGKHNKLPSLAVDFQPYPYPKDRAKLWASLAYVAGRAIEFAANTGVTLRWGGDWNRNGDLTDQSFDDLFHLEVIRR